MSSNHGANESTFYFDFNQQRQNPEHKNFTDLHEADDDSQSIHSISLDFDDQHQRRSALRREEASDSDGESHRKRLASAVNHPKSSDEIVDLIRQDFYQFVFMPMAKQYRSFLRCRVIRNKYDLYHMFRLEIEREYGEESLTLLTAEKQSNVAGRTEYLISATSKYTDGSYSTELQSTNIMGTNYSLINEHQQLAVILYESNFLGLRGPRKIEVLLPKFNNQSEALFDEKDIAEYDFNDDTNFLHLHNKPPEWNADSSGYALKFDGKNRVTKPSIKNFVIVIENDEHQERVVMQFGRMGDDEFSCDFRYPLTLMQAFGIALSAFDSRLFRE